MDKPDENVIKNFQPNHGPQRPQVTDEQVYKACNGPALRFSKMIVEYVNKFGPLAPFFGPLVAAFTTQKVVILCMLESFEPGSEEGAKAIAVFWDKCKEDTIAKWKAKSLKDRFGDGAKNELKPIDGGK